MRIPLYILAALMLAPTIVLAYLAVFNHVVTDRQIGGALILIFCSVYAALSASEVKK